MKVLTGEENLMMELPIMASELGGADRIYGNLISDTLDLSGYEAIFFRQDISFALEAVLSSNVSYNDSLVVLGNASATQNSKRFVG